MAEVGDQHLWLTRQMLLTTAIKWRKALDFWLRARLDYLAWQEAERRPILAPHAIEGDIPASQAKAQLERAEEECSKLEAAMHDLVVRLV